MAIRNFTLYDLLADIVPGTLIIVFAFILYDVPNLGAFEGTGLVASAAFFAVAYFVGRMVHSLGSYIDPLLKKTYELTSDTQERTKIEIEDLLKLCGPQSTIDESRLPEDISPTTLDGIHYKFVDKLGTDYKPKQAKRYGEALLYKRSTLYSKYEALVTSLRSMVLLPVVLFFGGIVLALCKIFTDTSSGRFYALTEWEMLVIVLVVLTSLVSMYAGGKFWGARNIAFINDLHITLTKNADE